MLPHRAGSSISKANTSFTPGSNQGIVAGFDPSTGQALIRRDGTNEIVRIPLPTGQRVFPGQVATLSQGLGGGYTGTYSFQLAAGQTYANGIPGPTLAGESSTSSELEDSCDISQNVPASSFSPPSGNKSADDEEEEECPEGYSPNCDVNGENCDGCKKDPEPGKPAPSIPGDPGDGCGGPGDRCDWYDGQSCPEGTFSKGFVEFPAGVFRTLCCGSEDRPAGQGCEWQGDLSPTPIYSPSSDGITCELNNSGGSDGRAAFGTLAECESTLYDITEDWIIGSTGGIAGRYDAPSGYIIVGNTLISGTGYCNSSACTAQVSQNGYPFPCPSVDVQPDKRSALPGSDTNSWGDNSSDCLVRFFLKAE